VRTAQHSLAQCTSHSAGWRARLRRAAAYLRACQDGLVGFACGGQCLRCLCRRSRRDRRRPRGLTFASDGRPKSFKADGKELLNEQDPGPGFELKGFAFNYGRPASFAFKDLRWDGKQLVASIKEDIRITLT
jgi:hypothetical protein